ncbi:MAG TPA: ATP-binding protein [Polyangia bacterium]|nr:ATP-binding protein [Polyangia bacterium]
MSTPTATLPKSEELNLILQGLADGITVQDGSGALVYANDAAAVASGFESGNAMLAAGLSEIIRRFQLWDEHGKPLTLADLPGRRAIAGEAAEMLVRFRKADGLPDGSPGGPANGLDDERWAMVRATPVRDSSGTIRFAVNLFRDVTEQRRGEQWQRFLGEGSALLASSLDYAVTLASFAGLAVTSLADWCAIDMRQPDRSFRCVAAAHAEPSKVPLVQALRDRYALSPNERGTAAEVLRSGRPQVIAEVTDQRLAAVARDARHLESLRALGLRSAMYVPLVSRGEVMGLITLATGERFPRYRADDVAVAEELSRRASISVDNARLYAETQESLRSREDLMAIVSHDLRNPLGVVLASSTLLLKSALPPDKQERARRQVEAIQRAGHRMNRLIRDLLDFASIQGGRLSINPRPYDAVNLAVEVLEVLEPLATQKSQRLERRLDGADRELEILCDHDRMIQVFSNVIGNAIKFTAEGGVILVGAARDAEMIRFSVADNGPGMSEEELTNIFDRYWQAKRRNRDGIGLGLSIAKGIIDAHGGRIWAESEIGRGTTFHFTVPAAGAVGIDRASPGTIDASH